MKIVHVPFTFHPDPIGGTEVYVEALACGLRLLGAESIIWAPGAIDERYRHSDLSIRRVAGDRKPFDLGDLYGEGDERAAIEFGAMLDEELPDVVHLHSISPRVGLRVVRQAAARRLPVVLTYHTPSMTCQRGTLMKWGSTACSGKLDVKGCTACVLNSHGVPSLVAGTMATLSIPIGKVLASRRMQGGAWTALRMNGLISHQQNVMHELLAEVDAIVAPAVWVQDLLRVNGVPPSKVVYCPQGIPFPDVPRTAVGREPGPLRVATLARIEKTKGLQVIVEALAGDRSLDLTLDIYGRIRPEIGGFGADLRRSIAADSRIRLREAIAPRDVVRALRDYDVLAVPSQGFETGPLVVLEAFAADIPVIGSDLGGIAERVRHEVDGLLVPFADPSAWTAAFRRLSTDPALMQRLRLGVTMPRAMDTVAAEMKDLYSALPNSRDLACRPAKPIYP